jgi:hypothetical protein
MRALVGEERKDRAMSSHVWTVAIVFASAALARRALRSTRRRVAWNAEAAPLADLEYRQPRSAAGVVAGVVPAAELDELHDVASELGAAFVVERPVAE